MFKRFLSYVTAVALSTSIFTVIFWYVTPASERHFDLQSPLPDFLTITKNKQVRLLDLWLPIIPESEGAYQPVHSSGGVGGGYEVSNLTARSVLMYDLTTNKTLFEKDAHEKLPMASLTKIMTAIISLENKRREDKYLVHKANLVGEDSMGVLAGETLSLDELLYGLMLPSGNDAAEVLASDFPHGGREGFIKAMNDKAKSLGLTDTSFSNPSGLQGDGLQYTTTYDLLVITRYALENFPEFKKIVSTVEYNIQLTDTHKAYHLYNETNLLTTYPGVKGVKTGFTPEAGLCLVTYLEYKEHRILGIILNSQNRRAEMRELLDYSLKELGITPPEFKG